ncbi:hypothetical protein JCM18918_1757 [Cutibacterium acnes JCM 18918]|nr:hypothetical protein JCM18918_1757 [Cutibacterium acnes JCM 18918]
MRERRSSSLSLTLVSATCRPLSSKASSIEDIFVRYMTGIVWGAGHGMTLLRR